LFDRHGWSRRSGALRRQNGRWHFAQNISLGRDALLIASLHRRLMALHRGGMNRHSVSFERLPHGTLDALQGSIDRKNIRAVGNFQLRAAIEICDGLLVAP
jgi:hypothetical protein